MIFFNQRIEFDWEVENGRPCDLRCASCGDRACVERCRGSAVPGGVV